MTLRALAPHPGKETGTDNGNAESALGRRITIQHTTLSGFRHHEAPLLWAALRPRSLLTLEHEADNPHDPHAVILRWRGRKLGYLPRGENLVVATLLDRQRCLSARIERLSPNAACNARIGVEVLMH
jgi:hypothetical protein